MKRKIAIITAAVLVTGFSSLSYFSNLKSVPAVAAETSTQPVPIDPIALLVQENELVNTPEGRCLAMKNDVDAIQHCNVSDDMVPAAVAFEGGLASSGPGRPAMSTEWTDAYCTPIVNGYRCTYQGVTIVWH